MTEPNLVNVAVTRFLGYGTSAYPDENPARLHQEFGSETASRIEPEIRKLLDELNRLKPDWSVHSLETAGIWAKNEMRRGHPELDEEALNALAWAFTWWWR